MKNIKKPHQNNGMQNRQETSSVSGVSKFDRYKNQDEDDDDMDEGNMKFVRLSLAFNEISIAN